MVDAFFYSHPTGPAAGFATIQLTGDSADISNILAVFPLHHEPVLAPGKVDRYGARRISLLDPLDMLPSILTVQTSAVPDRAEVSPPTPVLRGLPKKNFFLAHDLDPIRLWHRFALSVNLDKSLVEDIELEFRSSVTWQEHAFNYPPPSPSFDAPSVAWEQSIVQGHPTHPMHKTRRFLPPIPSFQPGQCDLLHPILRFISVPRENLKITYNFEELIAPLVKVAEKKASKPIISPKDHVIIPVHELQVYHIRDKFPEARIYPPEYSLPLEAQQSLRSVVVPNGYRNLHLKLAVGMKLTSAVRTISPESAYLGPRFSAQVVPVIRMDRNIVTVAKELASVVHTHPDGDIAKHCAALVREYHEGLCEDRQERMIVCTSLVEYGHGSRDGNIPPVIRLFGLDTEEKRIEWLSKFLDIFFRAFLPSVLHNGVAFECHPQNCVARFDARTKELKGFIIRDFGGIRVHPPTLKATTGVDIDFVEGHSIIAPDLDDVYTRMYHTVFHNHLQQLIRVLDLHYNGRGWELVRTHLKANIPADHPLYTAWLSPERVTLPGKCFMRMRLSGMYRHHLHGPFPNLIHYRGATPAQNTRQVTARL
ncbi:hypothetical protein CC1G_07067 [Coprinopsis cinerea okayama7|uniref:Aerobactin siderophore biosynthesis IucA/IucC N-terminal domain-containing protein n=1 Tax=Coprinopsis cinerea (strain Okayama-7 / 130 / ATCC MYA-4618 / FGSC 9003) TaxID=240176 RepID=A8NUB9_COPC7|nr:hypothetical protein CC1G_07067 [Coprinopsis cinerea okayama7\|eukprot:XP_001836420.2 hypothetical protein CC1G_07067 [Coprinopsis cinerea okayama7\